jgi:hypothetical protein
VIGLGSKRRDRARLCSDQIPLVDRDDQRPSFALDPICDAQVLFFELVLRIHHQHYDLGEANRAQCVGHRQLLQLLLDPRASAQSRRLENPKAAALPVDINASCDSLKVRF